MSPRASVLISLAAGAILGCSPAAAAFVRQEGLAVAREEGKGISFDDATIEEAFRRAEQLAFPMRLAVVGLERNPYGVFEDIETDELEKALLEDRDLYRDVLPLFDFLPPPSEKTLDAGAIRRAAARLHADAVLLYDQRVTVEQGMNPLALLNLTGVGYYLLPASSFEIRTDTRVRLLDVRNGVVYTTLRDVRQAQRTVATGRAEDRAKEEKRRLRREAFASVREGLKAKLARFRAPEARP